MAARSPRRIFSNPFVVTLAAMPACMSSQRTATPPPSPQEPSPRPVVTAPPTQGETQPDPRPTPEPKPEPTTFDQRWTVSKVKSSGECLAYANVDCPKPVAGKPVATCNPPPPMKYACPAGLGDSDTLAIVLRAGTTECMVDYGKISCPPNAACNPPRPRVVACPKP